MRKGLRELAKKHPGSAWPSADSLSPDASSPVRAAACESGALRNRCVLRIAASRVAASPIGKRSAPCSATPPVNAPPPVACPPGLPVFSAKILQRVDVHGLLRHDFLQPRIFLFQFFHPRHLRPLHPAVETPPAMTTVAISAVGFGFVYAIERCHGALLPSGPSMKAHFTSAP